MGALRVDGKMVDAVMNDIEKGKKYCFIPEAEDA